MQWIAHNACILFLKLADRFQGLVGGKMNLTGSGEVHNSLGEPKAAPPTRLPAGPHVDPHYIFRQPLVYVVSHRYPSVRPIVIRITSLNLSLPSASLIAKGVMFKTLSSRSPLRKPRNEGRDPFHMLLVPRPSLQTPFLHHGNTDKEKEDGNRQWPSDRPPITRISS